MVKKAGTKKQQLHSEEPAKKGTSFFDYLRFGESYTSLVLGIIVVIIATALLLSFVHNKNTGNVTAPISQQTQNTVMVSQQAQNLAKKAPGTIVDNSVTVVPTATSVPTVVVIPTPKSVKKAVTVKTKPAPTKTPQVITDKDTNVWVVQKGESLWMIAEKKYASGYNWVDIAKANDLADPGNIHVGDRLKLPVVQPKLSTIAATTPTVTTNDQQYSSTTRNASIVGSTYTVVKGDTLWNIAVRAYGDGYRWVDIAKANNLANPGLIFSGNKLSLPR